MRIIDAKTIWEGWLRLLKLRLALDSGEMIERVIVDHPDGSVVLPYDLEREVVLLVSQLRPPMLFSDERPKLEAISGALDGDEPAECARREALEEAGLQLRDLQHVASVWPTPATSTGRDHCYLAPYNITDKVGTGGGIPQEAEDINVEEVPIRSLSARVRKGEVGDAKTILLIYALRHQHPSLFS